MGRPQITLEPGEIYNELTVISYHHTDNKNAHHYNCKCSCGNECIGQASLVKGGRRKSCGCLLSKVRKNLGKVTGRKKLPCGELSKRATIREYKVGAKKRGLDFSLSDHEFFTITQMPCHYCGAMKMNTRISKSENGDFHYNGIDRVDSCKGYTSDNVVPCCKMCNYAKRDRPQDEYIKWVRTAYLHLYKNKGV